MGLIRIIKCFIIKILLIKLVLSYNGFILEPELNRTFIPLSGPDNFDDIRSEIVRISKDLENIRYINEDFIVEAPKVK